MAQTVASRVAFFEKFGQGAGSAAPSSCGKRVREVEAITSPGLVRDVKEKLLSPAQSSKSPAGADEAGSLKLSPGKVRLSVEEFSSLSRSCRQAGCPRRLLRAVPADSRAPNTQSALTPVPPRDVRAENEKQAMPAAKKQRVSAAELVMHDLAAVCADQVSP